ncbi:hypothetical protein R0J87_13520 [Halomonas sp. SIMBA_159]
MAEMTPEDAAILAAAMGDDAEEIKAQVASGAASLLRYADGSRIVLRLEASAVGQELVIVAGAGAGAREKVAELCDMATGRGWSVRFHTKRPALGRMLEGLGFTEKERVFIYGG